MPYIYQNEMVGTTNRFSNNMDTSKKPATKRTRISRGQSKNGCFTCKSRKVKCDEQKPTCARCKQARVHCDGYPLSAYEHPRSRSLSSGTLVKGPLVPKASPHGTALRSLAPQHSQQQHSHHHHHHHYQLQHQQNLSYPVDPLPPSITTQQYLVQAGLNLLLNSYSDEHALGLNILKRLVLKYIPTSPSVNAACAALGAANEVQQNAQSQEDSLRLRFETHYGLAIRLVRQDLQIFTYDSKAILTSCIILSSVELILRRRQDAHMHLRGAYQVFEPSNPTLRRTISEPSPPSSESSEQFFGNLRNNADLDMDTLLRTFDIQTLSFMKGARSGTVQPIPLDVLEDLVHDFHFPETLDAQIVNVLHGTLAYIHRAAVDNMKSPSLSDSEFDRSRYIILLQQWDAILTGRLELTNLHSERIHLLMLRNLCLSLLIETEALFSEYETAWDAHARTFQRIISSAEEIIDHHSRWKRGLIHSPGVGFTTQPSMIQPVYLAASKYRHHMWRRRAIACLRQAGREGPYIGEMMAAICERIMDLEESGASTTRRIAVPSRSPSYDDRNSPMILTVESSIPEAARISICYIHEENGSKDESFWPSANAGNTMLTLLKRKQPASVLPALVMTAAQHGKLDSKDDQNQYERLLSRCWEQWQERLEFSPGRKYGVLSTTQEPTHTTHLL